MPLNHCTYTLIYYLPIFLCLLAILGLVWLSPSLFTAILFIISFVYLLMSLVNYDLAHRCKIIPKCILVVGLVLFGVDRVGFYLLDNRCRLIPDDYRLGMCLFIFAYYASMKVEGFSWIGEVREECKKYWEEKSELVGEISSQLHNEKKLLILKNYF